MIKKIKALLPTAQALTLEDQVDYAEGSVVSKTLIKGESSNITLFAFDQGQGLSEHTVPFDAFVMILDGKAELTIDGQSLVAQAGHTVVMPANIPHEVNAVEQFKMILVMIRG